MPAVSKKQQRFFGIVRAIQKGEMAPTTPETAKAAADMKKSDVKDFASTKHKKLPEKKVAKEESNLQERGDFWHPDPEKDRKLGGPGANQRAREDRPGSSKPKDPKKLRPGESYMQYAKRMKTRNESVEISEAEKKLPLVKMNKKASDLEKDGSSKSMKRRDNIVNTMYANAVLRNIKKEETKYDRYDKQDKENKKRDDRMKFGKFYAKAKEAKDRLRPGEVKKWDPEKKRYVSNKE